MDFKTLFLKCHLCHSLHRCHLAAQDEIKLKMVVLHPGVFILVDGGWVEKKKVVKLPPHPSRIRKAMGAF